MVYSKPGEIQIKDEVVATNHPVNYTEYREDNSLGGATPHLVIGLDSEGDNNLKTQTTKNTLKCFDFDTVRLSANSSLKEGAL